METKDKETLKIGVLNGQSLDDIPVADGFDFENLSLPLEVKPLGWGISEGNELFDVFSELDFLFADDAFVLEMRQRIRQDCRQALQTYCRQPGVLRSRVLGFEDEAEDKSMAVVFPFPLSSRSPKLVKSTCPFLAKALLKDNFPNFELDGVNDMPYIKRSFDQRFPGSFEKAVYVGFYSSEEISKLKSRGLRVVEIEGTRSANSLWCSYAGDDLGGKDMYGLRLFLDRPKTGAAFTELLTALAYRGEETRGVDIKGDEANWISSARSKDSLLRKYDGLWALESKKDSYRVDADRLSCSAKSEINSLARQFLYCRYPDWQRPW